MKRISFFLMLAAAILFLPGHVIAQELTVDEIIEKAYRIAYYAGQDGYSDVKMTITDSQGRERNREFRILRYDLDDGGQQKYYVYFYKPADVAKMVYMVWKHPGQDDDRWLYLPALDLVRRIAASDKRSSFVGSHFLYEDVSGRGLQADEHELIETTDQHYKIKNTPKDAEEVEFAYYDVWIDKENFLPVKAEYYDVKDELIRRIEALEIQDVQGYPTVTKSRAEDLVREGSTLMEFSHVHYDVDLKESIFGERYLRTPPTQWIMRDR